MSSVDTTAPHPAIGRQADRIAAALTLSRYKSWSLALNPHHFLFI
jgi:hypothetical protein